MNRLEYNPTLVMLSDWDHFTSEEYAAAERNSNLDLLSVSLCQAVAHMLTSQ